MTRILVTGGAGMVGRALAEALPDVIATDLARGALPETVRFRRRRPSFDWPVSIGPVVIDPAAISPRASLSYPAHVLSARSGGPGPLIL